MMGAESRQGEAAELGRAHVGLRLPRRTVHHSGELVGHNRSRARLPSARGASGIYQFLGGLRAFAGVGAIRHLGERKLLLHEAAR